MGQICHHFGWELDYLLWKIDWRIVQRMLIDAPSYESEKDKQGEGEKSKSIKITEQNADELMAQLEKYR